MSESYTLNYVELPSADIGATRSFLKAAFNWPLVDYGPTYSALEGAGTDCGIDGDPESRAAAPMAVIETMDLELAERRVVEAGGTITRAAYDFPGGRRFHFREPGGNELAIYVATQD
jgi:predicted enzyme related to lactoylglutathione lyase